LSDRYFVEIRTHFDGTHPVHKKGCPLMPSLRKCKLLGIFNDGNYAVPEGLKYFHSVKACLFCIPEKPAWHKDDLAGDMLEGRN
jgi:hypothetical protein